METLMFLSYLEDKSYAEECQEKYEEQRRKLRKK